MHICAVGHHVCVLTEDQFPSLRALILDVTGQHVRRIDRFIQLALLGAGRCCRGRTLPADAALFLTSERGDIEVTVEIFESLYREKQPPRPLSFVNSVSNAACFYLATGLALEGSSQFIATHRFSFERALMLALLDLQTGRTDTALIGSVDVCIAPLERHRIRIGVEAGAPVSEATHWVLLSRDVSQGPPLGELLGVHSFADEAELLPWLNAFGAAADETTVAFGLGISGEDQAAISGCLPSSHPWDGECGARHSGYYDGLAAGVCSEFLSRGMPGYLLHVAKDSEGRYGVIHLRSDGA